MALSMHTAASLVDIHFSKIPEQATPTPKAHLLWS